MIWRYRHCIDLFKGATGPVMLACLYLAGAQDNLAAWLYTAMHGLYGLLWILKSAIFPDPQWERPLAPDPAKIAERVAAGTGGGLLDRIDQLAIRLPVPLRALPALAANGALVLYWVGGFMVIFGDIRPPPAYMALCVAIWGLGIFLHFAADMQKHATLKVRPGLIDTGLWARTRNPNYLGEWLIYMGYGLLAMHWLPVLILHLWVVVLWLPNMGAKDRSLSRHPGFAAWKEKTWLLFPKPW